MKIIENRKYWFIFSACVILIGLAFMIVNGIRGVGLFNYDVVFSGGTSFQIKIGQPFENADIADIITEITGQDRPQVQKLDNDTQVMFKIKSVDAETRIALMDAIGERYGIDRDAFLYSDVNPTVSADMKKTAVLAVVVACACMLIYVSFRFKDIRMGGSAIIALAHDALIILSTYAILRIPLDYSFIAVILTIIGYSINATIIIFDRIRENRTLMRKATITELVNTSVSQTLRRSILTTVTTLLSILCLYLIGVPSIKSFALPIIVGLVFGAYSSMCLSGAIWFTMTGDKPGRA